MSGRCEDIATGKSHEIADSAGVEIVVNVNPVRRDPQLEVAPEPSLVIGADDGTEAQVMGQVTSATVLGNGDVLAADGQARELKLFDPAGRHKRTAGGRGSGPGEYQAISLIHSAPGDTVWIVDHRSARITRLSAALATLDVSSLNLRSSRSSGPLRIRGILRAGGAIATTFVRSLRTEEVTNSTRSRLVLHHLDLATGATDSLHAVLGQQFYEYFPGDGSVWFGESPFGFVESLVVAGDRYYYGSAESFDIEERAPDGRLIRVIRVCERPDGIDPRELSREIDRRVQSYAPEVRENEERALRGIPQPQVAPAFLRLEVDAPGRLWVQDFTYPGRPQSWKVFTPDGRWQSIVAVPSDLEVLEIGSDYLLGRHTDDLGVQTIRLHTLRVTS